MTVAALVAVAVAVATSGPGRRLLSDPASAEPVEGVTEITVIDDGFSPPAVRVPVGTTITWTFADGGAEHNVVGDGWGSAVETDGTFARTFDETGEIGYRCTLHVGMDGRVVVESR